MEVADLLQYVRTEHLRDVVTPYLFSQESLLMYCNEALSKMARATHVFTEEEVMQTVDGQRQYDAPGGTVYVRGVTTPHGIPLAPYTRRIKPHIHRGRPCAFSMDAAQKRMTLHPTPDREYDLLVEYAYLPPQLEMDDDIPLPDDYALLLGEWMTYRALRNNDPDGSNTLAADIFQRAWLEGLRDMKREGIRYAMGDNPTAHPRKWT